MSFWGGLGRGLSKGLSFLGNGSPLGGLIGIGGAVASGIAQGGKQSEQNTNSTTNQASTQNTANTQTGTVNNQETEIPELSPFRRSTMNAFGSELDRAREPVFNEAMQANFIGKVNDTTNKAFESINQRLAARGAGAGGNLRSDTTELELARGSQLSDFFSQLPFKEAQARADRVNPLLNMGLSFAGRGPGGNTQTQNLASTGNTTGQVDTTSQGNTENRGPGILGGILGEVGDLAAGGLARGKFGGGQPDPFDMSNIDSPSSNDPSAVYTGANAPGDLSGFDFEGGPELDFRAFGQPQSGSVSTPQFWQRR